MKADLRVWISLHDVMPETLPQMEDILRRLEKARLTPITLLVVPGRAWQATQLARLRELVEAGHHLAAHGWKHCSERPRTLYHHLHARLLSRNVAEHLSLDSAGIHALMERSAHWFEESGLPVPSLYVPPAWALGNISPAELRDLPFSHVEVLRGLLETKTGRRIPLPMAGFETDTRWREAFVRRWNARQMRIARKTGRPLRLGLHPHDFQLRMASDLEKLIHSGCLTAVNMDASFESNEPPFIPE